MNRTLLVALIFLLCVALPLAWFAWQTFAKPGSRAFTYGTYGVASAAILSFGWAAHAPRALLLIGFLCLGLAAIRTHLLWPLQMWALRRRVHQAAAEPPDDPA